MSAGGTGLAPALAPVAEVVVRLGPPTDFGETRDGHRRVTPILGGELTWFGIGGAGPVAGGADAGSADAGGDDAGSADAGSADAGATPASLRGLRARILPGGGDRQLVRADAATGDQIVEIDAQYDAVADSGAPIGIRATGVRRPSGEGGMYFRVAVRFETADPALAELQNTLFVADGTRLADEVRHTVYRVC